METNTAEVTPIRTSTSDWLSCSEIRALLKSKLGYNARQVTVKERSSAQYLTITVRAASVDLKKVQAFAKGLDTWTMDNTDYCEGQSIHVVTTSEVDAIHAAPFIPTIIEAVKRMDSDSSNEIAAGKFLMIDEREAYIYDSKTGNRTTYCWAPDVMRLEPRAITHLALRYSRL